MKHPMSRFTAITQERFLAVVDANGFDLGGPHARTEQLGYTEWSWSNDYLDVLLWTRDGNDIGYYISC